MRQASNLLSNEEKTPPAVVGPGADTDGLLTVGFTRERYAMPSSPRRAVNQRRAVEEPGRERGRGRLASIPSEIPARGWKDVLLRVWRKISEDRIMLVAAGVTFYCLLAIFPAIAALVALYGFFADPTTIVRNLDNLSGVLPGGALDVIRNQMNLVASQGQTKLGVAFIIGFLISLWSANAGIKSIFDALNLVYDEEEKRGLVRLNLVSLAFTVAAILFVLIAIGCIAALPAIFSSGQLGSTTALIAQIVRWPILFVVIAFGLALVYCYGPSRAASQWRWISWGSAVAVIAWIAVSIGFSWYAQNFGSYNKTYGSLGAIIAFMFWLWLSTAVILIGAELDAEMEHQTLRDTTTGRGKPPGARGAHMADTVSRRQD
jgi:membrane protein